MKSPIAPDIYWSLPGPRNFIARITSSMQSSRMVFVNLPLDIMAGTWEGVKRGIHDAHISRIIDLNIVGGMHIPTAVGAHFQDGNGSATALARMETSERIVVMIRADGVARKNAEEYFREFLAAYSPDVGNVTLICNIHDESMQIDKQNDGISVIVFDGGLASDEMEAYVTHRMISTHGPGSTRLRRALVSEFAGFDAEFAEHLISLPVSSILGIQNLLTSIGAENQARWREASMMARTLSKAMPGDCHVMHLHYLSKFGSGQEADQARRKVDAYYWRACVKTLMPWMEERRHRVISVFLPQIRKFGDPATGLIQVPMGKKFVDVDPETLEYNNITGMYSQLSLKTPEEHSAMAVCRLAKEVRDDIAHMRPPRAQKIDQLIQEMEGLMVILDK